RSGSTWRVHRPWPPTSARPPWPSSGCIEETPSGLGSRPPRSSAIPGSTGQDRPVFDTRFSQVEMLVFHELQYSCSVVKRSDTVGYSVLTLGRLVITHHDSPSPSG